MGGRFVLGRFIKISVFSFGLIAVLLSLQGAILAAAAPIQITNNPANQGRPDIQNGVIVWKDQRNGNYDVYIYDLATGVERTISTNPAYQNVPATNGAVVLWQDDRAGANNNDFYMRGIGVPQGPEQLLVGGPGNQGQPAISGNMAVYVDDRAGNNDIYAINLTTLAITPVCTNPANQWQPRISGNRVVWEDNRNGNWDIYMKNLSSGVESAITADPGDDKVTDIDGDIVAWQHKEADGSFDIWMKNLSSREVEQVTDDAAYQDSPRISGDLIVWENYDYTEQNWDIDMKDLTSGVTSTLAGGPAIQARPSIDGDAVAWEATSTGNYEIWMTTVPDTTAPEIYGRGPEGGSSYDCVSPPVQALFKDNRVGVDPASVRFVVDGADVTSLSEITDARISYQPAGMEAGEHTASLSVADESGNTATEIWTFETSSMDVRLESSTSFWASLADYQNRELSVRFLMENASPVVAAYECSLLDSTCSSGVMVATELPLHIGHMEPNTSFETVIKYSVPPGIYSFKTAVYLKAADNCGYYKFLPGPPPGD
jgi:beta propeller repeat protein